MLVNQDQLYGQNQRKEKEMKFEEIEEKVIQWAKDRNFFDNNGTSANAQFVKLVSEIAELGEAIQKNNDSLRTIDGIGDSLVVLAIIAKFNNTTLERCLKHAYHEIKDRKGKMVNGIFVKEI
jgi:NTP pyrophosphatase (non-canonical NTP hydrolase)